MAVDGVRVPGVAAQAETELVGGAIAAVGRAGVGGEFVRAGVGHLSAALLQLLPALPLRLSLLVLALMLLLLLLAALRAALLLLLSLLLQIAFYSPPLLVLRWLLALWPLLSQPFLSLVVVVGGACCCGRRR